MDKMNFFDSDESYYYHVSLKKLYNLTFSPRIPKEKLSNENATIPRICVSDSVEGCLLAVKHNIFEDVILEEYRTGKKIPVYVYRIDKSKVSNVKTPREINIYVKDSIDNSEYWILDDSVNLEYYKTVVLDMLNFVVDNIDCSECNHDVNCHGCVKPNDWDELEEGKWEYKKGCYYPCVDDYEIEWKYTECS